jgi:hypothetical protein
MQRDKKQRTTVPLKSGRAATVCASPSIMSQPSGVAVELAAKTAFQMGSTIISVCLGKVGGRDGQKGGDCAEGEELPEHCRTCLWDSTRFCCPVKICQKMMKHPELGVFLMHHQYLLADVTCLQSSRSHQN